MVKILVIQCVCVCVAELCKVCFCAGVKVLPDGGGYNRGDGRIEAPASVSSGNAVCSCMLEGRLWKLPSEQAKWSGSDSSLLID